MLKYKESKNTKTRIGVVVGKAVHKSATRRNFWKRQAKTKLSSLAPDRCDLIIILSPAVNTLTRRSFQKEIAQAVAKCKK